MDIEELLGILNEAKETVTFLGDGVLAYEQIIKEHCRCRYSFAPAYASRQRAAAVAELGAVYYREGRIEKAQDHAPEYLRVSQAERERAARLGQEGQTLAGDVR